MRFVVHATETAATAATEDLEAAAQAFRFVPKFLGGLAEVPIAPRARVVDAMSVPVPYPVRCSEIWGGNLIEAFIHLVGQYEQQAKLASEDAATKAMTEASANLNAAGQVLNLFLDPSIADSTPFSKVRQQAFSLLDSERFAQVSEYMRKIEFDRTAFEWSYYGTLHSKFKLNLRHLFCNLDFAGIRAVLTESTTNQWAQNLRVAARHPIVSPKPSPLFWFTSSELLTKPVADGKRTIPLYLQQPEAVFKRIWADPAQEKLFNLAD